MTSYYNNGDLIAALGEYPHHYPVMVCTDHGQTPENVYSVQVLYRLVEDDPLDPAYDLPIGPLEELQHAFPRGEFEPFIMIN